ncbi:MAG: hypothetical protein II997_03350 [Clostridia bacterium]|nr:hypothetical protein [Clostridia bacterium]
MVEKISPVLVNPVLRHDLEQIDTLSGKWGTRLDKENVGVVEKWYENGHAFIFKSNVPGCLQAEDFGPSEKTYIGEVSEYLRVFKSDYRGTLWYSKSFGAEAAKEGERLWLNFGGISPTAEVWLNGEFLGENNNPFISFGFDVTSLVKTGDNMIVVRVSEKDRLFAMGYNCLGAWSGIYRGVELKRVKKATISELLIKPYNETGKIDVSFTALSDTSKQLVITIKEYTSGKTVFTQTYDVEGNLENNIEISLNEHNPWSPDVPFLYCMEAVLKDGEEVCDACIKRFGFIDISTKCRQFIINDEPYYMRGSGDFATSPNTVSPSTDVNEWRRNLKNLRDYGYNFVRCQSYMPVPEYFEAADEVGLIVQSELGALGAISDKCPDHIYPWPQPNAGNYQHILDQWFKGVKMAQHHPSARMWVMSNELASNGCTEYPKVAWKCYYETKRLNASTLIAWTDGGTNLEMPSDFINDWARGYTGVGPDYTANYDIPFLQHEFQWWSTYPDIRIADKYTGGTLPYEINRACESAVKNGLADRLVDFAVVSQNVQYLEAKGKLENFRRTCPEIGGICQFNGADCLTSPQGIIDSFYDKKLVDAETWRRVNGDCAILSGLEFKNRCYQCGDTFTCEIGVSDFSHPSFTSGQVAWKIIADGKEVLSGEINYMPAPGRYVKAGDIRVIIPEYDKPVPAVLKVELTEGDRTVDNEWPIYFFPKIDLDMPDVAMCQFGFRDWLNGVPFKAFDKTDESVQVVLTDCMTEELVAFAKNGGKVLYAAGEGAVRAFHPQGFCGPAGVQGRYYFVNPASYPPYSEGQYGTLLNDSPLYGDFPIEPGTIHAGLQFFNMLYDKGTPIDVEALGLPKESVVMRMIHTWQLNHSLAELCWCKCGQGSIVICSLELDQNFAEAPSMLKNLITMLKTSPAPETEISEESLEKLCAAMMLSE